MVFYRTYRPQTIEQLDLARVREQLSSVLVQKSPPHAFLFSGPKGLGKTSSARILAKAINCKDKKKPSSQQTKNSDKEAAYEPCNVCEVCTAITAGSHPDVLEIDAASNRGIDEIRELRNRIKYAPLSLDKKIYIIDEVHMLTKEAFNALLKTLEEPPSHVVFVLATTEPWRLPDTVVSRTFHVKFEVPRDDEIERSLQRIVDGEKINIDSNVLVEIGRLADRSFRDATKILEEIVLSAGDEKITLDVLEEMYHSQSIESNVNDLIQNLFEKDAKKSLSFTKNFDDSGIDFGVVCTALVRRLRNILFAKVGVVEERDVHTDVEVSDVERLIDLFVECYPHIKTSPLPSLPLEIVIVEWCVSEGNTQHVDKRVVTRKKNEEKIESKESVDLVKPQPVKKRVKHVSDDDFLKQLIEAVDQESKMLAGVLRGFQSAEIHDKNLALSARSEFHRDKVSEEKSREIVERVASELVGKKVSLTITDSN